MTKNLLEIKKLNVSLGEKIILQDIALTVKGGEIHALMGPNGSGKSTLAQALMGNPEYQQSSQIAINGKEISKLPTEQRAKSGLFLAMQNPVSVPGVSVVNLLRTAYQEIFGQPVKQKLKIQNPILAKRWQAGNLSFEEFNRQLRNEAAKLNIKSELLTRGINDNFSGGEKKKLEMLQAIVLRPKFAIFDEIDTGLDVDALQIIAGSIDELAKRGTGIMVITHYQRILKYLKPDFVHVLVAGKIVEGGKATLAKKIEKEGYRKYLWVSSFFAPKKD